MNFDFFEELLKKPSIFKNEYKLEINFIPKKLPHRNKELSLLSQLFLTLLSNPNSTSRKILITGATGIGKTATVKLFGELLSLAALKREINIKYIHINCRKERTSYKTLIKILHSFNEKFPKRGYSAQDLLDIIIELLEGSNTHLLIALDELNYLVNNHDDLIYSLTRLNDDTINCPQRISIIGIVRDISFLNNLDLSTLSTLQRNIIKFNKYSIEQIYDILKYRAEISLREGTITDEIIEMISELVFKSGDIRGGLNLLWKAGNIAESKSLNKITPECVRLSNQEFVPFLTLDIIKDLNEQELLFLQSINHILDKKANTKATFVEVMNSYFILCESLKINPKSYSQLWNFLQKLKKDNIISIKTISKNIKGRKSYIQIPDIPVSKLKEIINDLLKDRGIII